MKERIDLGIRIGGQKAELPDEFVTKSQLTKSDGSALDVAANGDLIVPAAGGSMLQTVKTTLNPTQIRALHTTPITLITAPGANKIARVISAVIKYDYDGAQAYSGSFKVCYNNDISHASVYQSRLDLNATKSEVLLTIGSLDYLPITDAINTPIVAKAQSAITNDLATGIVTIFLTYEIVDLS